MSDAAYYRKRAEEIGGWAVWHYEQIAAEAAQGAHVVEYHSACFQTFARRAWYWALRYAAAVERGDA